ncbi:hypothetical protein CCACVL1_00649, partial [Corchorus capsularis]
VGHLGQKNNNKNKVNMLALRRECFIYELRCVVVQILCRTVLKIFRSK